MPRLTMQKPRLAVHGMAIAAVPSKVTLPFYSTPEWRALLSRLIRERGRRCEEPNCEGPQSHERIYGDHVIELRDGGAPLEAGNVRLLCSAHHMQKTARERRRRLATPID
jgi:5-methylcytosine-specific restriction protein A